MATCWSPSTSGQPGSAASSHAATWARRRDQPDPTARRTPGGSTGPTWSPAAWRRGPSTPTPSTTATARTSSGPHLRRGRLQPERLSAATAGPSATCSPRADHRTRSSRSSRSSSSRPVDLSTCGQITILKDDENGDPLGGATFTITPNPFTGSGTLDVTDSQAPDDNDGRRCHPPVGVEPDEYEVCEKSAPAGYIKDTHCETLTVAQNGSAEFGPWENGLGDISWEKRDEQSGELIGDEPSPLRDRRGVPMASARHGRGQRPERRRWRRRRVPRCRSAARHLPHHRDGPAGWIRPAGRSGSRRSC